MQYDEVESIALMAGAYDLSVTVRGTNVKDVSMFVSQRLATLAGVLSTATSNVENVLNHFVEALAILLVTSCLIPILVVIFFIWLVKMVLGQKHGY